MKQQNCGIKAIETNNQYIKRLSHFPDLKYEKGKEKHVPWITLLNIQYVYFCCWHFITFMHLVFDSLTEQYWTLRLYVESDVQIVIMQFELLIDDALESLPAAKTMCHSSGSII
jgi:hypothetical protein